MNLRPTPRAVLRRLTLAASICATGAALADEVATLRAFRAELLAPAASRFAEAAGALDRAFAEGCTPANGAALDQAILAWEPLNAVAVGPLIERRSARRIDFRPTRPAMIEEGVTRLPTLGVRADALALIGTPAKGLPALAWLQTQHFADGKAPEAKYCTFAQRLAGEVREEAQALDQAFAQLAAGTLDAPAARVALEEVFNQWLGGLERLRWSELEKPVRASKGVPLRERLDSARWQAMWQGLRRVAVGNPESAALQPLIAERGGAALAMRWQRATEAADAAMARLVVADNASVLRASTALAALKTLAENEVANALDIRLGFSDADGD